MTDFAEFYAHYHRRLYGCAVTAFGPADADDLAQEAMVRAYASWSRLDQERDPWPWLTQILRNVARDRYARRSPVPLETLPGAAADATADVDERTVVRAALGQLSSSDRDVLVLRECHELTFAELSQVLGRSPNALRQQVFRARRRLADAYTAIGGRAVAVGWWARRWRSPAQVAAAVVTGAALVGGGVEAPEPRRPPAAAGPAVRMPAPAGPADRRVAPAPPLQRARATRSVAPRVPAPVTPAPGDPRAVPTRDPGTRVTAGPVGVERTTSPDDDAPLLCAVAGLCHPTGRG